MTEINTTAISVQELRIGNCLIHTNTIVFVTAIFKSHFKAGDIKGIERNSIRENISAIPLTHEILEKLSRSNDFYFAEKFKCDISKDGVFIEQYLEGREKLNNIKYLHRLQNLYYILTGQELHINL